jgi:hypothetical protein
MGRSLMGRGAGAVLHRDALRMVVPQGSLAQRSHMFAQLTLAVVCSGCLAA